MIDERKSVINVGGENYELLALKSAGISLPKIMRPLIILVLFVAVGSFFVANNLVPIATKKISALLYDIRQQKQSIEFKDGLFFNGMDDISIRVDRQDPKTKLLNGVLIYDTSDPNGNMTTTLADSGYISLSDDKKYLLVTLYSGERYEQARGYKWFDNSELRQNIFDVYNMVMKVPGFDFERTDQSMFNGRCRMSTSHHPNFPQSWMTIGISEHFYRPLLCFCGDPFFSHHPTMTQNQF